MRSRRSEAAIGWMRIGAVFVCMATTAFEFLFWQRFLGGDSVSLSVIGGYWALLIPSLVVLVGAWRLALRLRVVWHLLLAVGLCVASFSLVGMVDVALFPIAD